MLHFIFRQINPILHDIDCDVLPEIGELESGCNLIRKPVITLVTIIEKQEHQSSDRVGRPRTIIEQFVEICITTLHDILPECREQVPEKPSLQLQLPGSYR